MITQKKKMIIEKLIKEATVEEKGLPNHDLTANTVIQHFDKEKFAKLIIEECVQTCWTVSEKEFSGSVISECSKRMRKHFGVDV